MGISEKKKEEEEKEEGRGVGGNEAAGGEAEVAGEAAGWLTASDYITS